MGKKVEKEFRAKDNRGILNHLGTRVLLMTIGYVTVLVLLVSIVSAYGTYYFFGKEDVDGTWDFLQTGYVKNQVVTGVFYPVVRNMQAREQYYEMNIPNRRIKIRIVHNGTRSTRYFTQEELLQQDRDYTYGSPDDFLNNISQKIYLNSMNEYEDYNYPMPRDYAGTTEYYKISSVDYALLASKIGLVTRFDSLYTLSVQFGIDGAILTPEGQALRDMIKENEVLSEYFYLPSQIGGEDVDYERLTGEYFLLLGDSLFLCSFSDNVMYNDFMGIQTLNQEGIDYYIPSNYINEDDYEFSILLAPFFTSCADVILASLDEESFSTLYSYCMDLYNMDVRYRDAEYAEISLVRGVNESERTMQGSSSRGFITAEEYPSYAQRIRDNYDVVIFSDGKNVQSFYVSEVSGQRVEYSYLSSNDEWIRSMIPADSKITIGMNLDDTTNRVKVLYRYSQMVPQPVSIGILAGIVLLIVIFLLSIGVEGYTIVEHFPIELNLIFTVGFLFAGFLLAGEVLAYTSITDILNPSDPVNMAAILAVIAFYYVLVAEMYLTIVRRVKRRVFIKELLLVRFFSWLFDLIGRGLGKLQADRVAFFTLIGLVAINALAAPVGAVVYEKTFDVKWLLLIGFIVIAVDMIAVVRLYNYFRMLDIVLETSKKIENGDFDAHVDTEKLKGTTKELGDSLNNIRSGLQDAVEQSTRDERLKAELITNVSHDIKTPITSIINYVELLKWEKTDNSKIIEYVDVLDKKSQRLKQLVLDLVEASKVSTGNIELEMMNIDFSELLSQSIGEYEERFPEKGLELVIEIPETPVIIYADGRRIFRIVENLFQNALKYSMTGTRVYVKLESIVESDTTKNAVFSIKNISQERLSVSAEDLTRRFVRGDQARRTEGSGLGLSIAKNLTTLQGGDFRLNIDGDLFTAKVVFPISENYNSEKKTDDEVNSDDSEDKNEA